MSIENFIPEYPDLQGSDSGYQVARKKEFYDLRLERSEPTKREQGDLLDSQKFMQRFFSPNTPYDRGLIFGKMGTGKCVHPDTVILTNTVEGPSTAENLWKNYRKGSILHDGEGEWDVPNKKILILSYDEDNGKFIPSPISCLYRQYVKEDLVKLDFEDGTAITITKKHHLYNGKMWTTEFKLGNYIYCPSRVDSLEKDILDVTLVRKRIVNLAEMSYEGWVYDFEVQKYHNYVANGILCHNTCVISAITEINKNSQYNGKQRKPALIFVKSDELARNLMNEVSNVCTKDVYVPILTSTELKKGMKMTEEAKTARLNKAIRKNYKIVTYETFLKKLDSDDVLRRKYNGSVIMIDEAHLLRIQPSRKKKAKRISETGNIDEEDLEEVIIEDETADKEEKVESEPVGKGETAVMLYKQMHHFLHIIQDCKILLFTGTPIWDRTSEIASLMNLILEDPKYGGKDEQLPTGAKFSKAYFDQEGHLKEEAVEILKERFKGKVSFLREMITTAKRTEIGTKKPWLNYITVYPCQMSDFQAAYAAEAKEELVTKTIITKGKTKERITKGGTVRKVERDAANMVLPIFDKNGEVESGSYSNATFKKYAEQHKTKTGTKGKTTTVTRYSLVDKNLKKELQNNLKEYSTKLAAIIEHAKANPNEVIFIYTGDHVTGPGGAIMDGLILQEYGFIWAKSASDISRADTNKRRFAVITSNDQTTNDAKQIQALLESHNKPDNCYGDRLQIIIGSVKIALGFTIKHVRRAYIKMPHWNIPSIDQALFRGFRFGGHDALKPEERYIKIFRLVAVEKGSEVIGTGFPDDAGFSKTRTSDIEVYEIAERKEYKNTQIYRLLKEASFDCALNYNRNVLPEDVDGTRECDYRKCNYQCDAFPIVKTNRKRNIGEKYSIPVEELDYSTFNLFYSDVVVKKIRDEVIALFNNYFALKMDFVKKLLEIQPENDSILMKAIDSIIENRISIRNRYGFSCYLKEQGGILFLDNSISPKANYPETTYIENPLITEKTTMDTFVEILELESDKASVEKFCRKPTIALFENLSHHTKIVLLEASYILFRYKKGEIPMEAVKIVLDSETGWGRNLHTMSDANVIHVLYTEEFKGIAYDVASKDIKVTGLMRIFDEENESWKYLENRTMEEEYVKELKEENIEDEDDFEDNPYGIIAWISKKDKGFRIKLKYEPGKTTKSRGKICNTFKVPELVEIFIDRLNFLPEPREEYIKMKRKELLTKIKGRIGFDEYKEDLEDKDDDYLKRLLTLLTMHINELCEELKNWFEINNLLGSK